MPRSQFSDAYRALVLLLIEEREAAGITQAKLSERLKKPQPFISKIETGVRRVDVVEFFAIARAIGVDPIELLTKLNARLPKRLEI